jgi:NifU-like protein involved in Fe-S cluster formation
MSADHGYPEAVWARFRAPRHAGPPPGGARVGRGGDRRNGAEVELWVALDGDRIAGAGFRAFGCPYTVALADAACEALRGRAAASLASFDAADLVASLALPAERFGARIWVEDAVRAAAP